MRNTSNLKNSDHNPTIEPAVEGDVAKLKGKVLKEWLGVVRAEGRSSLLIVN